MAFPYKLATVLYKGFIFPVIKIDEKLYDINRGYEYYKQAIGRRDLFKSKHAYTMLDIMEEWQIFNELFTEMAAYYHARETEEFDFAYGEQDVRFLPPVYYPDKVLNAGSNYHDHAHEMGAAKPDKDGHEPYFFYKGRTHTLVGHGADIHLTPRSKYVDWEAELAVIIGKTAKNVSVEEAMNHIAGYTCYNDISARDRMRRKDEHSYLTGFPIRATIPLAPLALISCQRNLCKIQTILLFICISMAK